MSKTDWLLVIAFWSLVFVMLGYVFVVMPDVWR